MRCVSQVNAYLNETEPWKVIKEDTKRAGRVLYTCTYKLLTLVQISYIHLCPQQVRIVRNAIPKSTKCKMGSLNEIKRGVELGQLGLLFKKFD